jgi:hypothetical protein
MFPAGFEPLIPASQRSQTHVSECAATGIGAVKFPTVISCFSFLSHSETECWIQKQMILKSVKFTLHVFILLLAPLVLTSNYHPFHHTSFIHTLYQAQKLILKKLKDKVKQSRYRPGVAQRVPGS